MSVSEKVNKVKGTYPDDQYIDEEDEMETEEVQEQDEHLEGDFEGRDVSTLGLSSRFEIP